MSHNVQEQGDAPAPTSGRGSNFADGAKADIGATYDKAVRGGGARLDSFPALKTYVVSATGQHRREARPGTDPRYMRGADNMPRGTKMHSSGAKAYIEPSSEVVQGSGSNSCSAALSSVDNFFYDADGGTSTTEAHMSEGRTKSGIGNEGHEIGSEVFALIGDTASQESACEVVPRVPPSADLGGGSQEPGKERDDDSKGEPDKGLRVHRY